MSMALEAPILRMRLNQRWFSRFSSYTGSGSTSGTAGPYVLDSARLGYA